MSRAGLRGMVATAAALLAGCPSGQFSGQLGGNFFEPNGTVFSFSDDRTAPPNLLARPIPRLIFVGTYAYFDVEQDQSAMSGSDLAELRHEIEVNDWLVLEWADRTKVRTDTEFVTVLLRDSEQNIYRTPDPNPPADITVSPGFTARVRFRRGTLGPGASYECPVPVATPVCEPYQPLGSRLRVNVRVTTANLVQRGALALNITLTVDTRDGDPAAAQSGQLTGTMSSVVVDERKAENNLDALDLYRVFALEP